MNIEQGLCKAAAIEAGADALSADTGLRIPADTTDKNDVT